MATLERFTQFNERLAGFWKVSYLTGLWLAFSLLGLLFFGVGPATYALTDYYDRWFRKKEEPPVFQTFLASFKERYKQAVLLSWIQGGIATVLIVNIFQSTSWLVQVINVLMFLFLLIGSTHFYNAMVAFTTRSIRNIITTSVMMGVGYLHYTILLWTAVVGGYYLLSALSLSLLILFGAGAFIAATSFVGKIIATDIAKASETEEEK